MNITAPARQLIKDRIGLLRLLSAVPRSALAGLTLAMLGASLLPALTALAVAWLVAQVIDTAGAGSSLASVAWPMTVVGLLLTLDQITQSLLVPFRTWVAARVNGAVRQDIRQAVSARPGIEHLESQVVRDAAALPVENAYLFNMGAGAEGQLWLLTRFVGAVAAAAVVALHSPLGALAAFGFIFWQRSLLRRHYAGAIATGMVDTTHEGRAATYWSDLIATPNGAKELRLFGFGDWAVQRFYGHGKVPVRELSKVLLGAHRLHWTIFVLNALAVAVPFALLARLAVDGEIQPPALAAALGGVVAVARVLGAMGFEAFSIEAAVPQLAAVERLREFHATERSTLTHPRDPLPASNVRAPTIRFEDVYFCYPGQQTPVLAGLDVEIHPGESVALVGENGAGKTTLLKLLAGFYQPTAGRITADGQDIADLDPVAWRSRLAVIFQEFSRFELTALENVALAKLDHPDARRLASQAAAAASAAGLIDGLPRGWDTMLSRAFTDGVELSGGQWQRVALARALYGAAVGGEVLILDEPTASLDVDAEVALFDQLLQHAADATAIVVSHRFSTVRRAERIIVLAEGRVAEDGSHATLHAAGGTYARLYDLQANQFRHEPKVSGS